MVMAESLRTIAPGAVYGFTPWPGARGTFRTLARRIA